MGLATHCLVHDSTAEHGWVVDISSASSLASRQLTTLQAFPNWALAARSAPAFYKADECKANDKHLARGSATFNPLTVNATKVAGTPLPESKENADSAVVRLSCGGYSIVFAGNAKAVTEQSALDDADRIGLDLDRTALLIGLPQGADTGGNNSAPWPLRLCPRTGLLAQIPRVQVSALFNGNQVCFASR
ncbi:hypothetical protein [Massilia sp. IC2-476]|uniref:hypothetical protein n=1 Tax=Massilia sp. IC2-476 TaxID=2887199 RepID=UPI001D0FB3FB|nr:hypothetical protein [Massilia sp. IC2-476]MCC2973585.1 hypothetical protein [Massilia sp. IC2-476]